MLYTDVDMFIADESCRFIRGIDVHKLPCMDFTTHDIVASGASSNLVELEQYIDFRHGGNAAITLAQSRPLSRNSVNCVLFETICSASRTLNNIDVSRAQLATIYHDITYPSRLHEHDYMELTYVLEGEVLLWIDGVTIRLKSGDMCAIAPHTPHILAPQSQLHEVDCAFTRDFLVSCCDLSTIEYTDILPPSGYLFIEAGRYPQAEATVHSLLKAYIRFISHARDLTRVDFLTLSRAIAVLDVLHMRTQSIEDTDALMNRILHAIQSDIAHADQQHIANVLGYSTAHLARHVKSHAHMTFGQYIVRHKLEYATALLITTDIPMEAIARSSGFISVSYFYSSFKKQYQMSPLQYRKAFAAS
ncbi:AraC family transcriptional regulator [Alloscardovia omnicolens]|uniref:AraC family transcriptional regulator n=1 Tax=Alloscardovia omnicolens TaxID=419015 RepID=UPI003A6F0346